MIAFLGFYNQNNTLKYNQSIYLIPIARAMPVYVIVKPTCKPDGAPSNLSYFCFIK